LALEWLLGSVGWERDVQASAVSIQKKKEPERGKRVTNFRTRKKGGGFEWATSFRGKGPPALGNGRGRG